MPHPRVRLAPTDAEIPGGVLQALRDRFVAVRGRARARRSTTRRTRSPRRSGWPRRRPTLPEPRRDRPAVLHDRPAGLDGPRPGDAPRARRRRAPHPLRDRRRARVRPRRAAPSTGSTRERGQTVYCPDVRVPLHPEVLSEAAASLLPDAVRPAFVWDLRLDGDGALTSAEVHRAMVRSVERLDYADGAGRGRRRHRRRPVPDAPRDRGAPHRAGAVPRWREPADARAAGDRPATAAGSPSSSARPSPAEEWNAQVSLLTGMAAATMMLDAGVGILRTMPAPTADAVARFRRAARGLGVDWPDDVPYGDLVRSLDRTDPRHLALIHEASVAVPRCRVHGLRRHGARAARARCRRRPLRARHGTAAPPRRPVRPRRVRGREQGGDLPDAVRAALPDLPELMARVGPPGPGRRAGLRRRDRGRRAPRPGGGGLPRRRRRPHRQGHGACSSSTCPCWPGSPATRAALGRRAAWRGSSAPTCGPATSSSCGLTASRRRLRRGAADGPYTGCGRVGRTVASVGNTTEEGPGSEGQDGG